MKKSEIETSFPQMYPDDTLKECDNHDVQEVDIPGGTNATNVIPDEVPRRDGPGGE